MTSKVTFSPLALVQLDYLWDYGFKRFGVNQADKYLDGLFDALEELESTGAFQGTRPRLLPRELIDDITSERILFFRYENEVIYFRTLREGGLRVVSILGMRMDTPNRIREMIVNPLSDV
ncbi:MAG: type II toxin-antitoxin system RelE/ParE family toxin [Hahellaceae bacterium]|nr:type II toxin-antitoxin system RelE/ParE family toxin [Hahellaceae bacterium]